MTKLHAWAVVLAGGDGTRLQALTRLISGDDRPKQFCPIFESQTLLAQTRARLAQSISVERTLFALVKSHERYYRHEFTGITPFRAVIQPSNKGTAVAILYSLLHIARLDESAIVSVVPADHYYRNEAPFRSAVESAFLIAEDHRSSIVLLGAEPEHAEVEYGWIEPGASLDSPFTDCARVNRFWEKPAAQVARRLHEQGCFWNTFVMVGRAAAFLECIESAVPDLWRAFQRTDPQTEEEDLRRLYQEVPSVDFSHQVLSACSERLLVLRLGNTGWSDFGKPERVMTTLAMAGVKPQWAASLTTTFLKGSARRIPAA